MEGIGLQTEKLIHVYSMGVYECISHLFFFSCLHFSPPVFIRITKTKQNTTTPQLPNESSLAVLLKFHYSTKIVFFSDAATRFAVLDLNLAYQDSFLVHVDLLFLVIENVTSFVSRKLKVIKMS